MKRSDLPSIKVLRKAIEEFEYWQWRKASGFVGTKITNVNFTVQGYESVDNVDIYYKAKLQFDDHSETYDDCHVPFLSLRKFIK